MRNYSKGKKLLLFIVIAPVVIAGVGFVVMYLWNWLIPDLFDGPTLTFWQTLGLLLLSKILFGGFKGGHHYKDKDRRHWKRRLKSMTPEEREVFKAKWANKWGWGCYPEAKESVKENE